MEPIFGAENPLSEGATFKQINKDFRYIMREIANDPRALSLVKIHGITNIIDSLENQLNRCQNTLTAYINVCRLVFRSAKRINALNLLLQFVLNFFFLFLFADKT